MRPTILTVTLIIGIINAGLVMLLAVCGVGVNIALAAAVPKLQAMYSDPLMIVFLIISTVISLGQEILLLVGCIKGLKLRKDAPRLLWAFSFIAPAMAFVQMLIQYAVVEPRMYAALASAGLPATRPPVWQSLAGGAVGFLFVMVVPVLIWFTLTRQDVKDAFAGQYHPGSGFEVQQPPVGSV